MSTSMTAARTLARDCPPCPGSWKGAASCRPRRIPGTTGRYNSIDREVKAGRDLFRLGETGEAIYNLVDGWVALYTLLQDGRRQIVQFALPGTVLAFVPTPCAVLSYSAQALTDAVVCTIPHGSLARLARDYPELGMQLAGLISQDRSLAYDQLSSIGRRSARERVAHLLLELFMRSRMRWPGHRSEAMHLPLTHEDIGDATGLSGVHVNRVLQDLRKRGILEFHYRRLRILDPDKLVDVAAIEPNIAMSWITEGFPDEVAMVSRWQSLAAAASADDGLGPRCACGAGDGARADLTA